jgi:hypothetical protein
MQNKSKPFYIFPYTVNGVKYVEAYPIHKCGGDSDYIPGFIEALPSFRLITLKPSRNQARLFAYKLWIDRTGKGYKRFPFSPTAEEYNRWHKGGKG